MTNSVQSQEHPPWYFHNTSTNHIVLFHKNAHYRIDNEALEIGDVISAFYYDEFGNLKCGTGVGESGDIGGIMYNGENNVATNWGTEQNVFNGFQIGEEFKWKIWRKRDGSIFDATLIEYDTQSGAFPDSGLYITDGISGISKLHFSSIPGIDVSVNSILNPVSGCNLSDEEILTIQLENHHSDPADSVKILVEIYKNDTLYSGINETLSFALPADSIVQHSFSQTIDLSDTASYKIHCFAIKAGDVNPTNDDHYRFIYSTGVPDVFNDDSTEYCQNSGVWISPDEDFVNYLWSDGSTNDQIWANISGKYFITVTDYFGCVAVDSIFLSEKPMPDFNLGNDINICEGDIYLIQSPAEFLQYNWSTGSQSENIVVSAAGNYSLTVTAENSCKASDTVAVYIIEYPVVNLGEDLMITNFSELILDAGLGYDKYFWNTGSTEQIITPLEFGEYSVTVTNVICSASDTILIELKDFLIYHNNQLEGLQFYLPEYEKFNYQIFDIKGRLVDEESLSGERNYFYNTSRIRQGAYVLRFNIDGEEDAKRFFVD